MCVYIYMCIYKYICIYICIHGEEMYIFIKNTKIFPTKKQTKETGNDFVHLFSSFNRHLVNCSSCAVHSLHLAENCLGKTHKTM